ncbi:MAG: 2'-5' RNA ligase family protein, partial [Sphingomonadaceae bacterium]|nr:2'-5' RNA ligase family protein [Sphingomonadaceae bacterium]
LARIRADLADAFAGLLTPQDRAGWRPHVTVQNKAEPSVARALARELAAEFKPRPLAIMGLASWFYREGEWERIARYRFD